MGMFDYVDHHVEPCWKCQQPVGGRDDEGYPGWQSKDADCNCEAISPALVRRFYGICKNCRAWNEYRVHIPPSPDYWIELNKRASECEDEDE
jgi:hypothetical protein